MDDEGFWDAPARFHPWLAAIELHDRVGKQFGKVNGPIGTIGQRIALEVARECGSRGQVAAIKDLHERIARSRGSVGDAIKRLVAEGYLQYEPGARVRPGRYTPILKQDTIA